MATPHDQLIAELLDSRIPKTECEHAAAREIERLREALAEPEPVAWLSEGGDVSRSKRYMDEMGFICEPLYTAPPARKPLTEEQINTLWVNQGSSKINFARAIERAHGIGEA